MPNFSWVGGSAGRTHAQHAENPKLNTQNHINLAMMFHNCNPSAWEVGARV